MVRRYFPGVDVNDLTDEEFAELTCDASWIHSQMVEGIVTGLSIVLSKMFGGEKQPPKSPPRRPGGSMR